MEDKITTSPGTAATTEVNVVATAGTPKKDSAVKSTKPRVKPTHPKTAEMVIAAIKDLKERGGSSVQAIKKYIAGTYKLDAGKQATFIKKYLKAAVASGVLIQTKGKGAAGSFKLASTKLETSKPKAKSTTRSAVTKKATAAKKPLAVKKPTGTTTKKAVVMKTVAPSSEKKKVPKGPAAKPPKAKTTKAKPTVKSPVNKAKTVAPKKPKPAAVKPKKAALKT